jgi:hypothetical protein
MLDNVKETSDTQASLSQERSAQTDQTTEVT